jgi:protein-S-isoprenylcysteine O-methyltransferase Ste14
MFASEAAFHTTLAYAVIATGGIVFLSLFFITAPYGRHARGGWGPTLSNRLGWMIMESPAALAFLGVYVVGRHALDTTPLVLCAMWLTHYVHRAFVFPLRMRSAQKPMPISVAGMAIVFNVINAYLNARWISQLGDYSTAWLADPRFVAGALMFAAGMAINIQSDGILFSLRKPGESGYRIPHGGAYRFVSSPNYLGELIEWGGWAVATWSLAGLAFFLFTFANLVPRALAHHRWYRTTFPEYPKERRAVIPFLV